MSKENVHFVDERNIIGFYDDYRWLDNFFECPVMFEGDLYPTSENAFQAAKAMWADRDKFFTCDPYKAKELGRQVKMSERDLELWNQRRKHVMRKVVFDKFTRNPELREKLLATGNKHLEEANMHGDIFWGTVDGVGENNLGKLLMEIRSTLRGVG